MKCSAACPTTTQGPVAFNPFKNKSVSQKVRYNTADIDIINTQDEQQAWLHFENSTTYLENANVKLYCVKCSEHNPVHASFPTSRDSAGRCGLR